MNKIFCFGLGYVGLEFAFKANKNGHEVFGTVRSVEKQKQILNDYGIKTYIFNDDYIDPKIEKKLFECNVLLQTIAPKNGDNVIKYFGEIIKKCNFDWIGYLSTTGVYGNLNGGIADENCKLNPTGPRQQRRVEAEKQWLNINSNIFRLPGIYGVGRNVFKKLLNDYENCQLIDKQGHVFSRVMKQDIVNVLLASINNNDIGEIYNVADDYSCEPSIIVEYACELLGIKPPKKVTLDNANLSKMALTFWKDNKKICNNKVKKKLKYDFEFSNYKKGLDFIFKQEFENFIK